MKILDGAIGSELIKRGEILPNHIWSADSNIKNPQLVYQIHRDYINAGANYITTNTFRTTPRSYKKIGLSESKSIDMAKESLKKAVDIAKKASNNKTKLLGSIAPLEDCYQPKLFPGKDIARIEFKQIGEWLVNEDIDIFLLETMNNIDEIQTCLESISSFNLPVWTSFVLRDSKRLLSGALLKEAIDLVSKYDVDCLLLNCNPLDRTQDAINLVSKTWKKDWGIYPNLGIGEPSPDGIIRTIHSDKIFSNLIQNTINLGGTVLGGCCGSNPNHIKLISRLKRIN